ncbi:MAG: cytidylate kinase-like family protein [bacterium]|nr:cytidylate kinase-like family protein [bacterium]
MAGSVIEELVGRNIIRSNLFNHIVNLYKPKPDFAAPFITVSRDAGSGGRLVAQKIAAKLKFDFYDDKLLDEIANITKTKKYYLKAVDEKHHGLFKDLVQSIINLNYVDPLVYQQSLVKVIIKKAKQGRVVFVGRGANFITPRDKGLHLRITAPFKVRVQNTVKYEGLTYEHARKLVSKLDFHRSQFVKDVFGKDIRRAKYYDLVINTEMLSLKTAVEVAIKAFKQKIKDLGLTN